MRRIRTFARRGWRGYTVATILAPSNKSHPAVADKFDPYREALVMETSTVWPLELEDLSLVEKARLEEKLHADPAACAQLEYVRQHSGFCRQITVTQADVERLSG
jgi:hypothetical protein